MRFSAIFAGILSASLAYAAAVPGESVNLLEDRDDALVLQALEARQKVPPCNPGSFRCNVGWVQVCDFASNWQNSSMCARPNCCSASGNGAAFCTC